MAIQTLTVISNLGGIYIDDFFGNPTQKLFAICTFPTKKTQIEKKLS